MKLMKFHFLVMSAKLSFAHKDPPLRKAIKWALKKACYFIHLLIKDGSANLSFSSVQSFHCRYKDKYVCNVTGYKYRSLTSLCFITKGHSFSCYECSSLTGSCSDQTLKTCPSGLSKCMSSTTAVQVGKSNMMNWNSLLSDGDDGVFYWCCFTENITSQLLIYYCNHRIFYLYFCSFICFSQIVMLTI